MNGVHLIGSVPLADAEAVFRTVAGAVGPYLRRIPDGETGERRRWIWFQRAMLANHPAIEVDPTVPPFALRQWDGKLLRETPLLRFRPGIDPDGVSFETGYAAAAKGSYDEAYLLTYARALARARADIVASIPAGELAIQWDVCQEVLIFEGFFPDRPADYQRQIVAELARLGEAVPASVETGYHLCYGSPADEHLVMPRDTAIMVEMANGLRRVLGRRIDFLHLPVPKDRTDADYFRPLTRLAGFDDTAMYLGLIHHDDRAGDVARIEAARSFAKDFGVASECGWGRTDPERVPGLLASHRAAVEFMHQKGAAS